MIPKSGNAFSEQILRDDSRRVIPQHRRAFLHLLAGVPFFALSAGSDARESTILRLMKEARGYPTLSQRIDFISRALLGVRYQAHTLIGGPRRQEIFVTRDDAFDCVTYLEVVLAAALASDFNDYTELLRRIRYAKGEVRWIERHHDFAQWSRSSVANGICRPVSIAPSETVEKVLNGEGLGPRRYRIEAVATPVLMANQKAIQTGDVIGFVSRRTELDFFHTGFITFGRRGTLLLRHASQSRGKVIDEDMASFVAATGVKYVTLLRPRERTLSAQR